mgnify:CR=1 FL=1
MPLQSSILKRLLLACLFSFALLGAAHAQKAYVIGKRTYTRLQSGQEQSFSRVRYNTIDLAMRITQGSRTDAEKAEAIALWIAKHIEYDTSLRFDRALQKKIYTSKTSVLNHVLKRRKALCGGYAFLFQKLCNEVGIEAEVIHGYTNDYANMSLNKSKPNHSWNAVKLNGTWHLLDITWAISHGNTNTPKMFWYLTKPSDFIKTHYPQDSAWTLLSNTVTLREFRQQASFSE